MSEDKYRNVRMLVPDDIDMLNDILAVDIEVSYHHAFTFT